MEKEEQSPEQMIAAFKSDFERWLEDNPQIAEQMKKDLLDQAGVEPGQMIDEEMGNDVGFLKIPVGELPLFGTGCGYEGNKPFTQEVLEFLKSKEIEFMLAVGDNHKLEIDSAALQLSTDDAEKLSEMIKKAEGSLAYDFPPNKEGWSFFASE